ncbi:hypothetical protein [Streptomyces millisiae]|uniref:Uncharacterized protein n=1 Tax=Streptomyces millisiae TaxID=3075542 RepID=A0ABU2LXW8_9ACTN|nr:hypothetical protein [Streptomyces sp. DSM 44918]MDT0321883.1 hypothetical protein [Streptomyces sp. DSM 44918]
MGIEYTLIEPNFRDDRHFTVVSTTPTHGGMLVLRGFLSPQAQEEATTGTPHIVRDVAFTPYAYSCLPKELGPIHLRVASAAQAAAAITAAARRRGPPVLEPRPQ